MFDVWFVKSIGELLHIDREKKLFISSLASRNEAERVAWNLMEEGFVYKAWVEVA
jgi:hypothetical protein